MQEKIKMLDVRKNSEKNHWILKEIKMTNKKFIEQGHLNWFLGVLYIYLTENTRLLTP